MTASRKQIRKRPAKKKVAPPKPAAKKKRARPRKPVDSNAPEKTKGGARPGAGAPVTVQINWEVFEALARVGCTTREIAAYLGHGHRTISTRCVERYGLAFGAASSQFFSKGKCKLREAQFNLAILEKNPTMQIWLGKQYLDQTDRQEIDIRQTRAIKTMTPDQLLDLGRRYLDVDDLEVLLDDPADAVVSSAPYDEDTDKED